MPYFDWVTKSLHRYPKPRSKEGRREGRKKGRKEERREVRK